MTNRCLIVGFGYLGSRIAKSRSRRDFVFSALTRSFDKASMIGEQGVAPIVGDWYQVDSLPQRIEIDSLVVAVSHAPVPGIDPTQTHVQGLENLFSRFSAFPQQTVYVSTTGVYAACDDGRWVDEYSPVEPNRPGAVAALSAEAWLTRKLAPERLTIFRAAGIYGPERVPSVENLRQSLPLSADPDSFLNLIHVEDLAELCVEAMRTTRAGGLYNVSDGSPVLRKDYYRLIAELLRTPDPVFATRANRANEAGGLRKRSEGSKRISNRKLVGVFEHRFEYPDYRSGLGALLGAT